MNVQLRQHRRPVLSAAFASSTAAAYDAAGRDYLAYADGDASQDFCFDGTYGFADREIWQRIERKLAQLAADGHHTLRVLDAGCGPGTWLRRVVLRARALGFKTVLAYGFDLSPVMVNLALAQAAGITTDSITLTYTQGDITGALPFEDHSFDLSLCLYGVLNHLPAAALAAVAAELARVTSDTMFVTVRAAGSQPTIYVDGLARARAFHQDNVNDWMDVDLEDGRRLGFRSHLFTAADLQALFEPHLATTTMFGLDVFHSRFASHPDWNPPAISGQTDFEEDLDRLEKTYASSPHFIDRAVHILLIGENFASSAVQPVRATPHPARR